MSSLNDQLNSFKSKVRQAPTIQRRTVDASEESGSTTATATATGASKRKSMNDDSESNKKKKTIVYSQPASTGMGAHAQTQLVHAVDHIKAHDAPLSFEEVSNYMSTPADRLIPMLKNIDRIKVDDKNKTVEYVSIYNIYSAEQLLAYLQAQRTFKGIPVKHLKDGWNGCLAAVEKLEKEQKIVVWRTKKENSPRYVWANTGGSIGGIDETMTALWQKVRVPATSELPGELEKLGLKPTSVDPATIKKQTKQSEQRKQKKPRRGKITNTHMRGVLKDYGV